MAKKNQLLNQVRQGDLLIERVKMPKNKAELAKNTTGVLAYGEVTGHAHRATNLEKLDMYVDGNGDILIEPKAGCGAVDFEIVHDEHAAIPFEYVSHDGYGYRVSRQREYDANAREQERRVAD